jgi:hypothetical protein
MFDVPLIFFCTEEGITIPWNVVNFSPKNKAPKPKDPKPIYTAVDRVKSRKNRRSVSHIFWRLTSKTGLWHDNKNICVCMCACVLLNLSEQHWAVSLCTFRRQIYCCYSILISSIYVRYLVLWEDFLNHLKHRRHYINQILWHEKYSRFPAWCICFL